MSYGQLDNYLESLGYRAESGPTYLDYTRPDTRLPIILPKRPESEDVPRVLRPMASQPEVSSTRAAKPKEASTKSAEPKTIKAAKARRPERSR
jgi:hypothetical protein